MVDSYKIATLNVNGMATQPWISMLEDFLLKQEIDILLQELMRPLFDEIPRSRIAHQHWD
jgi:exonuclease III